MLNVLQVPKMQRTFRAQTRELLEEKANKHSIQGSSVTDRRQLKQSQRSDGKGSTELWKNLRANWQNHTDVVEEHKNKTDILELQVKNIVLLCNLPKELAMGNMTDHKGRETKAWAEEFE